MAVPVQPFTVGVIVKITVTGALVVFTSAPLILPDPLAAMPVTAAALSLVQLKVVPLVALVKATGTRFEPEQMVWVDGVATATGLGFTNTVARLAQLLEVGVTVNVT